MKVATTQPYEIVYSLFKHEFLGYLLESFVIQKNSKGELTLRYQNISSKNAKEFSKGLNEVDYELVNIMDSIQPEMVIRKFYNKKLTARAFFQKIYVTDNNEALKTAIDDYINDRKAEILQLITEHNKNLFVMGSDGAPAWRKIMTSTEAATILFHFRRNEDNTHYFPTIKHKDEKLDFVKKGGLIVCNEPAWFLLDQRLYHFKNHVDGYKLKPFLSKKFIAIPRNVEETYFHKFVAPLIASYDVYAKGFEIKSEYHLGNAVLLFSDIKTRQTKGEEKPIGAKELLIELFFEYENNRFKADEDQTVSVRVEKIEEEYIFHRIKRDAKKESNIIELLDEQGLSLKKASIKIPKIEALQWLEKNIVWLKEHNISIQQNQANKKRYFIGQPQIEVSIKENKDWFDIHTKIQFGPYEISFLEIRKHILRNKTEFELPNGEIAIIPDAWLADYSELFHFTKVEEDGLQLHKQHLALVASLDEDNNISSSLSKKLQQLHDFDKIEDYPTPENFKGELRPYQKAGYNWMRFLQDYRLGGCLADDMGLGKTIQTLAVLQADKEAGNIVPSLVVVPTSLIYNWEMESKKFTPDLKIFKYTGTYRNKDTSSFEGYDIVITTYGLIRIDIELLREFDFNYIILDESQTIKNPTSNISKAVLQLNARNKLILTGTPLENTTLDLWSQMNFVNDGLLGSLSFFKKEYLTPIEKNHDETKLQRLYQTIKPFILRRNKTQVAKDLPPKIENIQYCEMSPDQEEFYEKIKNDYRNQILEQIEEKGVAKTQFLLLKGLTQLRQIANHPNLVDKEYTGQSGKFDEITEKLKLLVEEGTKVLIFSQFVKHLSILKKHIEEAGHQYCYIDGSTKDRQGEVDRFQNDPDIKIFLISLKAGGVGLNITAASYVFILDPWWNPAIEAQAIDRAHRIGQKQTVFTYKFITKNSVEEKIVALQNSKKQLANELITAEKSFMKSLSKDDIMSLID